MLQKMITASLSPNVEFEDVYRAVKTLLAPSTWKRGNSIKAVYRWFQVKYSASTIASFSSGRMAETSILKAFGIGKGDEVLVQAFTCVAVANSALWADATPVFVDIDESGNIDVTDAAKKITPKTKALIVQHTFGIAADIHAFVSLCKSKNIVLIEDCAHSLGVHVEGKLLGTFGDAAFFSFGRDKVVSSVWGGIAILNASNTKAATALRAFEKSLPLPSDGWIAKQLLHPIIFAISMPFYRINLGKAIIELCRKLHLITLPIYKTELRGGMPKELYTRYPNALASLILLQLNKLDRYTAMRNETTKGYIQYVKESEKLTTFKTPFGATYLRFPILVSDPSLFIKMAKKEGILLGNWYGKIIDPKGVSFDALHYTMGSCPQAEDVGKHIVNLPTRLTNLERERVYSFLSRHV